MTTNQLRELLVRLDKTPYPEEGQPETKLLRLAVALNTWDYPCVARIECGYVVQDANHVGEIEMLVSTARGTHSVKVRASAWGDLVTFVDPDSAINAKREEELRAIFKEQGYVYVPHKLLQERYPEEYPETWFRRFFDWQVPGSTPESSGRRIRALFAFGHQGSGAAGSERWVKTHIPVLVTILVATISVGCRKSTQVSGGMAPTITNKEQVTINYLAYAGSSPRRWEVVALRWPSSTLPTNSMFLKRVIALPGETISLCSTGIVVNGTLLNMPAAVSNIYCPPERLPSSPGMTMVSFPFTVPPKHYFVVGDNWTNSLDSRYYGAVPGTNIIGRVVGK